MAVTGAKPEGVQPQQPDTRQLKSRDTGSGAESRSPAVFSVLHNGAGDAAARPAAMDPTNNAPSTP